MVSRVVVVTVVAGLIACTGSNGISNPLSTGGNTSGITITAGDSAGIAAWRPSVDTASLSDTIAFTVAVGTTDTFDVVWTLSPTGATAPVNSPKLTAGSNYVVSFTTPGIYAYMDTFHPGVGGGLYIANDNYGQRVRWCGSAPCKP